MNLAALSLIALAIAVTLSGTTKINVGIGCYIVFGLLWGKMPAGMRRAYPFHSQRSPHKRVHPVLTFVRAGQPGFHGTRRTSAGGG